MFRKAVSRHSQPRRTKSRAVSTEIGWRRKRFKLVVSRRYFEKLENDLIRGVEFSLIRYDPAALGEVRVFRLSEPEFPLCPPRHLRLYTRDQRGSRIFHDCDSRQAAVDGTRAYALRGSWHALPFKPVRDGRKSGVKGKGGYGRRAESGQAEAYPTGSTGSFNLLRSRKVTHDDESPK
jgi:hypothetical protein